MAQIIELADKAHQNILDAAADLEANDYDDESWDRATYAAQKSLTVFQELLDKVLAEQGESD